ncbi:protein [Lentinula edodes]|uniref:Protein n=1 Tax=Lentinula edodes TaxID=5353 RepID=A0A1Q3ENK4_LENED|nr:protein [Lentinula edodes]
MRTYSTLIPGNTYNSKASVRELDSDVVEARGFVVDDNSLEERSSALSTEGPTSPMKSNVQSSLERRINQNLAFGLGGAALAGLAVGAGFLANKIIKEHAEKQEESSSTSSSATGPTSTDSGNPLKDLGPTKVFRGFLLATSMKRGFLTTAKAKQRLGKDDNDNKSTKSDSSQKPTALSPNQSQVSNLLKYSDFDEIAEPRNFSYGVVDEAGLPEGYDPSQMAFNSKPVDPNDPDAFFFVTLPPVEKGATLADYPGGWTECCVSGDVKRVIENTSGFPSPPLQPLGGKPYRIADAGDKGLGVFATRMIRAGELIMDERPLIVTPNSNTEFLRDKAFIRKLQEYSLEQIRQITLHEMDKRVKKSFDRMPLENQKAFMDLFNSHSHDGSGEYIGRTRTNAAGIDVNKLRDKGSTGKLGQYSATCNEFSRLNHCCCPNAIFHWHTDTFTIRVCAVRDIPAGAEITVEYCPVLDSAAQRAQSLAPYDF